VFFRYPRHEKKNFYTRDQFSAHLFFSLFYDATMTRLSDTRATCDFFLRDAGALFVVMVATTINGNFFTVHVHNGLIRRKATLFITTTRCSSMQGELVPSDIEAILSLWVSICRRHRWLAPSTEGEHCPLFYTKKRIFSFCFDTMLYGISCVCARTAHIDLVLVPCIGTLIDLEFSFRRCLQSKTAH
jgi:hypothetical protein